LRHTSSSGFFSIDDSLGLRDCGQKSPVGTSYSADVGGHGRPPARHGLDQREREALADVGEHHHVAGGVGVLDVLHPFLEPDGVRLPE
jgi:hypothetical protein